MNFLDFLKEGSVSDMGAFRNKRVAAKQEVDTANKRRDERAVGVELDSMEYAIGSTVDFITREGGMSEEEAAAMVANRLREILNTL